MYGAAWDVFFGEEAHCWCVWPMRRCLVVLLVRLTRMNGFDSELSLLGVFM